MSMSGVEMGFIITLANSIIGVGILAMPFCFQKCGVLLSILLLIFSNLMTRLTCNYLLQSSIRSRKRNLESMALHIFGSSGKLLVELSVIGYLFGSCVTYYVVVGDLGPQILSSLFNISLSDSLRSIVMVVVTIICIIPLSLLRSIESLSHVSATSIVFYFCLVLKIMFDSEEKITSNYWFNNIEWWRPSGVLQCLPIFCMSLSCQTQVFEVYESLPNQSLEKMNRIVKAATNICTSVYILVGLFGYLAYSGQQFSGNILLNFSSSLVSEIIKLGFVLSVAFSFPLVIFPCRASLYSLIYHRSYLDVSSFIPAHRFQYLTILIVLTALVVGILIPSIELVIGLVGSTTSVAICIIFPSACFIKTTKKGSIEKLLAQFLLVFGFVLMILGTFANLEAIDEKQAEIHENVPFKMPENQLPIVIEKLPNFVETDKQIKLPRMDDVRKLDPVVKPEKPIKAPNVLPANMTGQIPAPENVSHPEKKKPPAKVEPKLIEPKLEPIAPKPVPIGSKLEPIGPKPKPIGPKPKPMQNVVQPDVKVNKKESAEKKVVENEIIADQDQLANAKGDSVINKDAIQKEEQEIAIEANAEKQKNLETAKEILKEVKSEFIKQNEERQKIVLEKIDKISAQVDKIEQLQEKQKDVVAVAPPSVDIVASPVVKDAKPEPKIIESKVAEKEAKVIEKVEANVVKEVEPLPQEKDVKIIPEKSQLQEPKAVNDPVVESILPKAIIKPNADGNVDHPSPDDDEMKIGRELLSAKMRVKRSIHSDGSDYDEEEVKSHSSNSTNSSNSSNSTYSRKRYIRIKNRVHPKYSAKRLHDLREALQPREEKLKPTRAPAKKNKNKSLDQSFDDSRFEKYVGLYDSAEDTQVDRVPSKNTSIGLQTDNNDDESDSLDVDDDTDEDEDEVNTNKDDNVDDESKDASNDGDNHSVHDHLGTISIIGDGQNRALMANVIQSENNENDEYKRYLESGGL